jgi:hypothetical protein
MMKLSAIILSLAAILVSCDPWLEDPNVKIQVFEPTYSGGANPENSKPFTYLNTTYAGMLDTPANGSFQADAFFIIKGSVQYTEPSYQYSLIKVTKNNTQQVTSYWIQGNFIKRIWLRFGAGSYTVEIFKTQILEPNLDYQGDINKWNLWTTPKYTFHVTNTRNEDGIFIYPSDPIQSDDPIIQDRATIILSGAYPDTTEHKTRLIYDYVIASLDYDHSSLEPGCREKQDALTAYSKGYAVCEGYTSLLNALLRASGIPAKCISGYSNNDEANKHAWSHVYDSSVQSWYYCDATWDDKEYIGYQYFWKSVPLSDHTIEDERPERSMTDPEPANTRSTFPGYPEGSY